MNVERRQISGLAALSDHFNFLLDKMKANGSRCDTISLSQKYKKSFDLLSTVVMHGLVLKRTKQTKLKQRKILRALVNFTY